MKSKRNLTPDLEEIIPILIGVWRRFHKESGPADRLQTREFRSVVDAVKALQENSWKGKPLHGSDYFEHRELLGAYLLYQWIIHYQQALSLIGELPTAPRRVLDICSGPAPLSFAALRHGATEVFATDRNQLALDLGAEICGRYGLSLNIRRWNCLKGKAPIEGKFDLIILGHCLNELFPATQKNWVEAQTLYLKHLIETSLNPNGCLLVVESSQPEENRRLLMSRDRLVSEGFPVQAPCVWRGECPALKTQNSPCYAQRELEKPFLIKEIQRAASINLSSLKMSYVIFRTPHSGWPDVSGPVYRVISPPVETYQGTRFYLCGTDGKKTLGSHLTTHSKETRAFEHLKRGELIAIENPLIKDNALDLIKDSKIKVVAPLGKPLVEDFETKNEQ